ncbi:RNA-dependent RNA polymerase 2 isoform X1 [Lycium barbarum]|uniref:RNA-dependent RNA polymerase 2 isoform X1 n=1 Tax=Lycium barbarum TaxID=112863 RepID=UPI00293E1DD1|nr:RNA-dependent RNA polymerase 2 isoform X1 [Lycium barbarum]
MGIEKRATTTVKVTNIPQSAIAKDLFDFFDASIGKGAVFACDIFSEHKNWKSRGHGRVQFETLEAKSQSLLLSEQGKLVFKGYKLVLVSSFDDIISRPVEPKYRFQNGILHSGVMVKEDLMEVLESWGDVKTLIMPERKSLEFWVSDAGECYRLEVQFSDIAEASECSLEDEKPALLLKLKHAPKLYQRVSGTAVASKFSADRYHICKEDCEFLWVRTTDFSGIKSIGCSSSLCWKIEDRLLSSDLLSSLPYYNNNVIHLFLVKVGDIYSASEFVPLVSFRSDLKLPYEILFQLNSLVHAQKISLGAVDTDLIEVLSKLELDTAVMFLQKMQKLQSTCFEPVTFIKTRLHVSGKSSKNQPSSSYSRLVNHNMMSVHRVLVTPSKIYCLGPELETSNYIVKNFASHASDFLRVTFVEEDWSKLSPNAISMSVEQGIFAKPYRTKIYHRILSILREGIVIGTKRFFFLAFSASQLRSNSVWMFASNEYVKAEDIREWMGCFNKIRSVSKCAARMGQLFSTSFQTMEVQPQHVEILPDIEVTSDGVTYCFSDGIGKISQAFARQVAEKCGLDDIPSAFQIRYGGYKGVIAVDRNSFRKLSLRGSMLKFESKNRMLNITKWSDAMPCYLNREIVILLSTLGVEDKALEELLDNHLLLLGKMLTTNEAALDVLESIGGGDVKKILMRMLLQGYAPNLEPYLSMMLQSHFENQLSDLRSRCRIFIPKGRVLVGCLDETGILDYGQVYVRITMNKAELQNGPQNFFEKVDEKTAVVRGKVVVTKNPCLHPGDIRVLDAVYEVALEEKAWVDCIIFPQKGERPHPNECSGGDLDGDLYFISWDENLIPKQTVTPMDYTGRRPRIMDHEVTLEEIQRFFVDYMISDTLGAISTAHLVHADREPDKALNPKCLQLATLHSMAVDFAKTGAAAEMPRYLKPREFPDFMERWDKPMYISEGVLGKLYRGIVKSFVRRNADDLCTIQDAYDHDLLVEGYEDFLENAKNHKEMYLDKMSSLLNYYGAEKEVEILTGNLCQKSEYLKRDNRRYFELKDRILVSAKSLRKEVKGWFTGCCKEDDHQKLASAWYHVTYHPNYCQGSANCLGFPWVVGDILLDIKSRNTSKMNP